MKEDFYKIDETIQNSSLYSEDLAPIAPQDRTWTTWNLATLWVGMAVCIPTYMLAASMITSGISWWGALLIIGLGNLIVTIPMVLNGHAGTKYGIPFPVVGRAAFGTTGIHIASLIRALVACGWFGIQTWLGGLALFAIGWILAGGSPAEIPGGTGLGQFIGFGLFWLMNVYFIWKGTDSIRWLEEWSAPILIGMGLLLIGWGWSQAGSFGLVLQQSEQLKQATAIYNNDNEPVTIAVHPLRDKNGQLKATKIAAWGMADGDTPLAVHWMPLEGADLNYIPIGHTNGVASGSKILVQFANEETQSSIVEASQPIEEGASWLTYLGFLTIMVGFWGTMAISVADITRYVPTQRSQILGQFIGLPGTMILYSFVGIFVTCAAIINFDGILIGNDAPWDPVQLLNQFESKWVVLVAQIFMLIATLSTNIAANVIAPANAFSNVAPKAISFRTGGFITAFIGILICPWALIGDIIPILLFVSGLLGPVLGVLVADYFLVRKTKLNLMDLYNEHGQYGGFNFAAMLALAIGVGVVLLGFFVPLLEILYQLSWFTGFFASLLVYWGLGKNNQEQKIKAKDVLDD
ncbi:NCS1 family nucleobase:cation symporter-1 [Aureispira anguillae]|uniref:NCS1 family nucleobase:cation symporter-1 n=1 Tax=Aureispira anguillae TaxID=2864201 RepID=A0A915YLE5_9BACT|nr:NCS1 family nucleobase:cation symporter-1 [Aureispira anguillae]BDS15373.1 NCS1 family nucleobase:cation symporter-1 [Aureispira anguillae]